MWSIKEINFVCRIVTDDNEKFKFDLILRENIIITDGKSYDNFKDASSALHDYLNKIYNYETNLNKINSKSHLIVNETI